MSRMKKIYFRILTVVIILCVILVAIIVFNPQKKLSGYSDCIKESITAEEPQQYNYASGNIRDATVTPEACLDEAATPPETAP